MATSTLLRCDGCSFEQDENEATCARCGLIVARAHAWKLLGAGLVAALLAHQVLFEAFILSPLVTLLHEFGHAACAWLLGCPAIPAFDFVYGGGVTHHKNFQLPLGLLIAAGWVWLGYTFRRNPRTLSLIVASAALWLLAISADWRREVVIAAMGHGGELILSGALLYMALSGVGWRIPEIERPLGAFAALFVWFQTVGFAWRLRNDADFLNGYLGGKGGAMMNDLEVVALDVKIWTGAELDVPAMAGWLLGVAWIPPVAAILLYVFRERVNAFGRSLLLLDPD